jgi:hypothetical protein
LSGPRLLVAALSTALLPACLPADTRAPPGKLTITVSPSDATLQGLTTDDGFTIAFERVLVSLGHTALDDECNSYSEARYYRLLDLGAGSGQTLGLLFGLGACDVQFRFAPPDSDAVRGAGVTEADDLFMRTPLPNDGYNLESGVALDVVGSASRDGFITHFHWSFRQNLRYSNCGLGDNAAFLDGVTLHAGDDLSYDVRIETEALFRDDVDPAKSAFRFAPFAAADLVLGNGDGQVSLDELGRVQGFLVANERTGRDVGWRPAVPVEPPSTDNDAGAAPDASGGETATAVTIPGSLADFVYLFLVPTLPRFRDVGRCETFPTQQLLPQSGATPLPPG